MAVMMAPKSQLVQFEFGQCLIHQPFVVYQMHLLYFISFIATIVFRFLIKLYIFDNHISRIINVVDSMMSIIYSFLI